MTMLHTYAPTATLTVEGGYVTLPLTGGHLLVVDVDGEGDLTLWQYKDEDDLAPEALCTFSTVHPIVWQRATSEVPRMREMEVWA